jgi:glutamine---fructose-6-phosphate transaminase (isomerizing)
VGLRDEILEQPDAVRRLLAGSRSTIERIAAAANRRRPTFVLIAARGTSDHAALYAQYVFGIRNSLVVALATPSALTLFGAHPALDGALVLGISQSGRSPDIVAVLEEGRRQGALTVAVTNDGASPLAGAADEVVELHAGVERATAATKTYTSQLFAVGLMSAALEGGDHDRGASAELADVGGWLEQALTVEPQAERLAGQDYELSQCVVLGRGYDYATAREWALKLQELAHVMALPFSAADFEHGPLALLEPGFRVLAVAPSGRSLDAQLPLLRRLQVEHAASLVVVSDSAAARGLGQGLNLPSGIAEWLTPLVSIVPGQLFAYHLTRAKGLDPDRPRTISKVTETR